MEVVVAGLQGGEAMPGRVRGEGDRTLQPMDGLQLHLQLVQNPWSAEASFQLRWGMRGQLRDLLHT